MNFKHIFAILTLKTVYSQDVETIQWLQQCLDSFNCNEKGEDCTFEFNHNYDNYIIIDSPECYRSNNDDLQYFIPSSSCGEEIGTEIYLDDYEGYGIFIRYSEWTDYLEITQRYSEDICSDYCVITIATNETVIGNFTLPSKCQEKLKDGKRERQEKLKLLEENSCYNVEQCFNDIVNQGIPMEYVPATITMPLLPCTDSIGQDEYFIGIEKNYDSLIKTLRNHTFDPEILQNSSGKPYMAMCVCNDDDTGYEKPIDTISIFRKNIPIDNGGILAEADGFNNERARLDYENILSHPAICPHPNNVNVPDSETGYLRDISMPERCVDNTCHYKSLNKDIHRYSNAMDNCRNSSFSDDHRRFEYLHMPLSDIVYEECYREFINDKLRWGDRNNPMVKDPENEGTEDWYCTCDNGYTGKKVCDPSMYWQHPFFWGTGACVKREYNLDHNYIQNYTRYLQKNGIYPIGSQANLEEDMFMTSSVLPNSCTNIQDLNIAIRPSKECGKNVVYYRTSHPNGWQEPNNIRLMHVHDGTNCTGVCKLDFLCDGNLIGSINITGNCEEPQENNQTQTEESSSESSDGSSQESSEGSSRWI